MTLFPRRRTNDFTFAFSRNALNRNTINADSRRESAASRLGTSRLGAFWLRALVTGLVALQIVAPLWHVCAMGDGVMNGHDMSGHTSHAQCAVPQSAPRATQIEYSISSHSHSDSHSHDENADENHDSHHEDSHHEVSQSSDEENHDADFLETDFHAEHSHGANNSSHAAHENRGNAAHEGERCAAGKDDLCCIEDRNRRMQRENGVVNPRPAAAVTDCLAMLLTTMPGRAATFHFVSPLLQSRVLCAPILFFSRGATPFTLCDARAPPYFSV